MNRNRHRVVFNAARGQRMVVAENASSASGETPAAPDSVLSPLAPLGDLDICKASLLRNVALHPLTLSIGLAFTLGAVFYTTAHAQIVADPNAPANQRPIVLQTGNGIPLVQIRTPSAAGVSRNTYGQFDIQSNGAVLNNVRSNAAQTQIGGFVQANPFLSTGAARVILNEVNSSNPSYLNGPLEVAGQRAEVIVANPAGIRVNGGTFLNAAGVTLTTGTPVIRSGHLDAFLVGGGTVHIEGLGLDTRTADSTTILARAVEVNAGLWAEHLKVVTGANEVSADASTVTSTPASAQGAAPQFALDVAAIGGMYAGKIHLIGTEAGLGINNAGRMSASSGDFVLQADGWLRNTGSVQAQGNLAIQTTGAISNTGAHAVVSAQGDATVSTGSTLANSGGAAVVALGNLGVSAPVVNNTGGTLAAGGNTVVQAASLTGDGTVQATGNLSIDLTSDFESTTDILSGGDASVKTTGSFTNRARLQAGGTATVQATDLNNTATAEISGARTTLRATNNLVNRGLIDGGETRIDAGTLTNIGTGLIYGDHVAIAATTLTNDTETVGGTRSDAVIAARERLDLGVGTLTNREHALIFSAGTTADALNIGGALDASGHATGSATAIHNNSATIESLGGVHIAAAQLNNTNLHFATRVDVVGGPESLKYIQPEGSSTKVLASNFVWESWSRAGQYRYNTSPPIDSSGVLGVSPVPRVGEQDCTGEEPNEVCTRLPGADYLASNPAWAYFGLTAPSAEPVAPTQAEPVAPAASAAASCTTGPGYDASACAAYNTALTQYNADKAAYDTAWASYATEHTAWQSDADAKYTALDGRIETYNAAFAGAVVRTWTEFNVTRTESETQVASSEPGQILSGGDMRLSGGDLVNDKSRIIAGGTLTGDLANLRNIEAEGQHIVHEEGTSEFTWPDWKGGVRRYHKRDWGGQVAYLPADEVTTITLPVTEKLSNTQPVGTGTTVQAQGDTSVATPLPTSSLFVQHGDPSANYLIETDPRFTNYRQWLGSDYMLNAMSYEPGAVHKRLGDGFYEQRLIREQVAELTGRRFLDGYASDEAQFRALMDAGMTYAQEWSLVPGVALSAEQMARLTSDIVWLVAQEVTLADGTRQTVLAPKIYLRPREGDLAPSGALLSAQRIDLNLSGDLLNAGTVAGRTVVNINARTIDNLGQITGQAVAVTATEDVNLIGGRITAQDALSVQAGRDVNITSTTQSGSNTVGASSFSRTSIDRVAGLYVTGENGTLIASAGRDLGIVAGVIENAGTGDTRLQAVRDVRLSTVTTAVQENSVRDESNYLKGGRSEEVGSQVRGAGNVSIVAGGSVVARAANVQADKALSAQAGGDITIEAGEASSNHALGYKTESGGLLGKRSTTVRTSEESTIAVESSLGGREVSLQAGQNVTVRGSSVVSDQGTALVAGEQISIEAGENRYSQSQFREDRRCRGVAGGTWELVDSCRWRWSGCCQHVFQQPLLRGRNECVLGGRSWCRSSNVRSICRRSGN